MQIQSHNLLTLAERLTAERKRQGLSRSQAAAVCNVSTSFIRDAESTPERCSLGKLLQLVQGLGLVLELNGWPGEPQKPATPVHTNAAKPPLTKDIAP